MPLQQHHVDELKAIYEHETGKRLSNEEAWEMAHRLISLFTLLLKKDKDDSR